MIRKPMTWLQWTCCIGWLWVPSHQATQSLLLSSMDLNCHAEMASSSLRYMIGNMYNVSSLTFISRFSNHSWVAESFMARVYTSHIASYKAIVDHLMVTEAHWSDLETIQQALGDTSLLLKAMFLGFLQGKGVPCPNLSPPCTFPQCHQLILHWRRWFSGKTFLLGVNRHIQAGVGCIRYTGKSSLLYNLQVVVNSTLRCDWFIMTTPIMHQLM